MNDYAYLPLAEASERLRTKAMSPVEYRSCTRPLRIIILPPNRVKCPQLDPFWREQGHGLTPV